MSSGELTKAVIARSAATKQSSFFLCFSQKLDCFAEPVIGRRFAPTRWLAMTTDGFRVMGVDRASRQQHQSRMCDLSRGACAVQCALPAWRAPVCVG
jgi:hypothetical protein